MTYYANNNQIKEVMLETTDVGVNDLSILASDPTLPLKDVTLYLFDTSLFFPTPQCGPIFCCCVARTGEE